jgi:thioredoxin 1
MNNHLMNNTCSNLSEEEFMSIPTKGEKRMNAPIVLTDENFAEEVLKSALPVLVDFWATWCGPCQRIAPIVEELAGQYHGKAKIGKLDVDSAQKTAAEYGIRSIPTLLIFKGGKVAEQVIGAVPKKHITEKLDAALAN